MSGIIGLCGIFYGLYFVFTSKSNGFTGYYDLPSLVLLGLLPPSIMLLSHKLGDFFTGFKILTISMFQNSHKQQTQVINALSVCSARVRSEGMGALVLERKKLPQGMLNDGISLIISNFSLEEIRHNLKAKMAAKQSQMALASNLFENMSKVAPGVGMIGTLVGLISMMSKLGDPAAIGAGMALALITTLYGLLLGTLIYAPLGEKIAIEAEKTFEIEQLVLEGVLALKAKKSSLHMKNIMNTYANQGGTKEASSGKSSTKS